MRRYSDFIWLCDQLRAAAPEVPLPALPPKSGLGGGLNRHEKALRRLLLWKFLHMCAHHPSLCELEVLRDFLTRGFGFNKTKAYANETASQVSAAPPPKASWMDKMKAKVKSTPVDMKPFEVPSYNSKIQSCHQLASMIQKTLLTKTKDVDAALSHTADAVAEMTESFIVASEPLEHQNEECNLVFTKLAEALRDNSRVKDLQNENFTCHLASQPAHAHYMLQDAVNRVATDRQALYASTMSMVGAA